MCAHPPLQNKASTDHTHSPCDDEDMEAWNQVFRIRYGGPKDTPPTVLRGTPPNPLPLTLPPYSSTAEESTSSSESEGEEPVAMETTSVANWESFQSEVSKQLLARHFYSCECCMCIHVRCFQIMYLNCYLAFAFGTKSVFLGYNLEYCFHGYRAVTLSSHDQGTSISGSSSQQQHDPAS